MRSEIIRAIAIAAVNQQTLTNVPVSKPKQQTEIIFKITPVEKYDFQAPKTGREKRRLRRKQNRKK